MVGGCLSFGSRLKDLLHHKIPIHKILFVEKTGPQIIVSGHIRENSREDSKVRQPFRVSGIFKIGGLEPGIAKLRNPKYPFG